MRHRINTALTTALAVSALSLGTLTAPAQAAEAYPVHGAIASAYQDPEVKAEMGAAAGAEDSQPNGDTSQDFDGGTIYWIDNAPAIAVKNGAILSFYKQNGALGSKYGRPMTPEEPYQAGQRVKTYNKDTGQWYWLTWSPNTGVVPVLTTGGIGGYWERNIARLGSPVSPETCTDNGQACSQTFSRGTVTWSVKTPTSEVRGGFNVYYVNSGAARGPLGAALGNETPMSNGGAEQKFVSVDGRSQSLIWNPKRAKASAVLTNGGINGVWREFGRERGGLGFPTSDEISLTAQNGVYQDFDGGKIYWSPATGAQKIQWGGIYDEWAVKGWENGSWGYPTSGSWLENGKWIQNFQGGQAVQNSDNKVTFTAWARK
ncbi:LGFP repeat-containing protein [Kocuria sp. HSID16901]|uniref:LGFP repeat-containing protein n=1 Tax=Kocuria sp. HSID16901 TaxID=2419505 RepID=UPI00065F89FA|nr:hypothetical protein [Kocuria sp. HSID16901]MCT1367696.1 hypothetical protein [Rothia sp. p3-SID1597]RUQ20255.1 hypothetical protein D8M21_09780 [Kocuria sp. HSID16901]